jgi:hypothetical protein
LYSCTYLQKLIFYFFIKIMKIKKLKKLFSVIDFIIKFDFVEYQ